MQSKTVLVADYNISIIQTTINYLRKEFPFFTILSAPDAYIAYEIAQNETIDLVILDWEMLALDGMDTLILFKKNAKLAHIPIIIATEKTLEDTHLSQALQKNASDYLRKPISSIELNARVRNVLFLAEAYQEIKTKQEKLLLLSQQEKNLMQSMTEQKARELLSCTLQIVQKNRVLDEIQQVLSNKEGITEKEIIKSVAQIVKLNQNMDNIWEKMKIHFDYVHPNFFRALHEKYITLSSNELKICAFIRMQLDNKDIAYLLNLSYRGIETARYRIRSKMQLETHQDLGLVLLNIA